MKFHTSIQSVTRPNILASVTDQIVISQYSVSIFVVALSHWVTHITWTGNSFGPQFDDIFTTLFVDI